MTSLRKLLLACLVGGSMAASASGESSGVTLSADIAPQPLADALATFGRQTGLQLLYLSGIAEAQHSKGARAGLTASAALTQLLDGTGLTFEFLNARTVRIFPASVTVPTPVASLPAPQHLPQRSTLALEEVIVTATRREEAVNRVPINMVVWTQDAMEASGVKGMGELASLTPAMQFQPSPS
ncbi:MAG: STN domain-containing protein, partial [Gammaproteobacteria bacterium]|nr:STN domain-containing protein [Gammaproteobacteria bacterium]